MEQLHKGKKKHRKALGMSVPFIFYRDKTQSHSHCLGTQHWLLGQVTGPVPEDGGDSRGF